MSRRLDQRTLAKESLLHFNDTMSFASLLNHSFNDDENIMYIASLV